MADVLGPAAYHGRWRRRWQGARGLGTGHRTTLGRYAGTLAELAEEAGDLRYDALAEFLGLLAEKVGRDAAADEGRGRPRLAALLREAAGELAAASGAAARAWGLCEPHMKAGERSSGEG